MPKLIREKQWLLDSAITFNNYPTMKIENIEKLNKTNERNQRRLKRQNKKREEITYLYTTTETYKYKEIKEMETEQDRLGENMEKIADIKENLETRIKIGEKMVYIEIEERKENELKVIRRIGKILKGNEIPAVFMAEKWNKII